MSNGLLFGADHVVAETCFELYGLGAGFKFDACIGIVGNDGKFKGAILLHGYQGYDVQMSYYGAWTLTPGIARAVAQFIIEEFDPARLTVIVNKRNKRLIRSCLRFGFKLEGVQPCYYGKQDCNRNTGVRLVGFRREIDRVANVQHSTEKVA
jgi:hypothetical protein